MKLLIKLFLLGLCVYYVPRFCMGQTDGFTILRIQSKLPKSTQPSNSPKLPDIFSQDFAYLGSGGQAYAFGSADGKYVIKFFKHHRHSLHLYQVFLPGAKKRAEKREHKRLRDMNSYRLCIEELPEETGLLYVHLDQTDNLKTSVRLIDKLNIAHHVDLDNTAFILQKQATLAYEYIGKLIEENDIEMAEKAIASICDLMVSRCKKGIFDEDPQIHRNVGFVNGSAIVIDVGRLKKDPTRLDPHVQREDLKKITSRMKKFLEPVSPTLVSFLDDYVENQAI